MTAAAVLANLNAAGIRLEVREGALLASPRAALTDDARALIGAHKPALLVLLTVPRRLWLIQHAADRLDSHSFTPPATLAEVRGWYPLALTIQPEPEGTS